MDDIARECGVTKMTVSRVLAGHRSVREATRDRVLRVAQRLDYEVNILARNFTTNRSGFIGVAVPFKGFLGSEYLEAILIGASPLALAAGIHFALFDTNAEASNDGRKLAALYRQRRVDGLLVIARHTEEDSLYDKLEDARVPMVTVGENTSNAAVSSVSCDNDLGTRLMCQHLYDLGHRRIAFAAAAPNRSAATVRRAAYESFCREHALDLPPWYVQVGDFTMQSGRRCALELLRGEPRPTAVLAVNDATAFGVMEGMRAAGLRVPEDVSVSGYDDLTIASMCSPGLTTIHQPVVEMGALSAKVLLEALANRTAPARQETLDVSLVVRNSTAPPPTVTARAR